MVQCTMKVLFKHCKTTPSILRIFTMTTPVEQFVAANKASVDALLALANSALASSESIASLNLNTARSMLETGMANAKAVIGAKDPQEALAVSKAQVQPAIEQAVAYNRSLYEISVQSRDEVSKQIESQLVDFRSHISGLVEKAAENAPDGSEVAVAAVMSAFEAANSAFGNMKNVVKQASEIAEANITKATSATIDAATKATKKQ
jgi:phasin family protein